MPMGIILTDEVGKILQANTVASDMLDGCPLLCLEDELASRDGRSDADLRAAISYAGSIKGAPRARKEVTSLIVNGPGARSLAVWVMPITGKFGLAVVAPGSPRVAIFAAPIDTAERFAAEMTLHLHPRTIAESRLLALLARALALDKARRALSMPNAGSRLAELLLQTASATSRTASDL